VPHYVFPLALKQAIQKGCGLRLVLRFVARDLAIAVSATNDERFQFLNSNFKFVSFVLETCRFEGLDKDFFDEEVLPGFEKIYNGAEGHLVALPGDWNTKLSSFQKLCFLRTIRQDKVIPAMTLFVAEHIGIIPTKINS
jgi:hypothetical protein